MQFWCELRNTVFLEMNCCCGKSINRLDQEGQVSHLGSKKRNCGCPLRHHTFEFEKRKQKLRGDCVHPGVWCGHAFTSLFWSKWTVQKQMASWFRELHSQKQQKLSERRSRPTSSSHLDTDVHSFPAPNPSLLPREARRCRSHFILSSLSRELTVISDS